MPTLRSMDTNGSFYVAARQAFPLLAGKADRHYIKYWDMQPSEEGAYSWFASLANALNEEMRRQAFLAESEKLFQFVAQTFGSSSDEVKRCIDVSFVENLFWQVPPSKSAAYWNQLPTMLQTLYVGFHSKPPV